MVLFFRFRFRSFDSLIAVSTLWILEWLPNVEMVNGFINLLVTPFEEKTLPTLEFFCQKLVPMKLAGIGHARASWSDGTDSRSSEEAMGWSDRLL